MKITDIEYQLEMKLDENRPTLLILEEPAVFTDLTEMMYQQCMGNSGRIVLSDEDQILAFSKTAAIVSDYFSLDLNSRQIQNHLYRQMRRDGFDLGLEKEGFTTRGIELLENIITRSRFDYIDYNFEIDWNDIFKLYRVRIEEDYDSLQEKLIAFMRLCSQLLGLKLLMFVNLKSYLNGSEVREIYRMAAYFKLYLLLIESHEGEASESEKRYIIDTDRCLIIK